MKELKKPCEAHRLRSLKHQANSHRSLFIPKCGEDGYYAPMQCSAKNKFCWCVNKNGNKKRGSRTKGLTDCSEKKEQGNSNSDFLRNEYYVCLWKQYLQERMYFFKTAVYQIFPFLDRLHQLYFYLYHTSVAKSSLTTVVSSGKVTFIHNTQF